MIVVHRVHWSRCFSALQRAENSSIPQPRPRAARRDGVSVLFSEPKIPQFAPTRGDAAGWLGFSALQRAENSSIEEKQNPRASQTRFQCSSASRKFLNLAEATWIGSIEVKFQCSSASRKFLNPGARLAVGLAVRGFSALQRAENSSIDISDVRTRGDAVFQCSSASRKFLNQYRQQHLCLKERRFSALQRAENSSI